MPIEEKLWRWYERHKYAVNAVLEIAQDIIPGGKLVFNALRATHAYIYERKLNQHEGDIQETSDIKELQEMMSQIKPEISDLVEEIEQHQDFQNAANEKDSQTICKIVEEKFSTDVNEVISKISPVVSISAKRISPENKETVIINNSKVINQKYRLIKILGKGGQGEVYEALDLAAEKHVAVKFLPAIFSQDTSAVATLRAEYNRVVDKLVHANIVQYRSMDQDVESNRWFLVMDYIPGSNLRKWLIEHRNNPISLKEATSFLGPIASALDFAHQNKVVHCDLKPENILIRERDGKLFLADFGLAKEIHSTLSTRNIESDVSGTLPYMAPEQYLGRWPDEHTDNWALGIILYEMVAGYHPFKGINFEHYKDLICHEQPERPMILNHTEWELLLRFLEKDRTKRLSLAVPVFKMAVENLSIPQENIAVPPASYKKETKATTIGDLMNQRDSKNQFESTKQADVFRKVRTPTIDPIAQKELEEVRKLAYQIQQQASQQEEQKSKQASGCWGIIAGTIAAIVAWPFFLIIFAMTWQEFVGKPDDIEASLIFLASCIFTIILGKKVASRLSKKS